MSHGNKYELIGFFVSLAVFLITFIYKLIIALPALYSSEILLFFELLFLAPLLNIILFIILLALGVAAIGLAIYGMVKRSETRDEGSLYINLAILFFALNLFMLLGGYIIRAFHPYY